MATVKDVARAAGVSLGTVSNVLNGKESVKPELREKVYRAIQELDFQYNMTASALRTKATKNIGLIIPTIVNPYYPELARGVEDAVQKSGFTLFLGNSDRLLDKEKRYIDSLLSRGADGLILVKTAQNEETLERLSKQTPLVLVDYQVTSDITFPVVNVNDTGGMIQGMSYLWHLGHRKIAFIGGLMDSYSSRCRIEAYRECLKEWGFPSRPEYIIMGDYSWNCGYEAFKTLMSLTDPPTAIFAANDIMALGIMKGAEEAGIKIPEQLSVMGYDNIEMSSLCKPKLTTIHQPKYQVGVEAVRLLGRNCDSCDKAESQVLMETRLVIRDSAASVCK